MLALMASCVAVAVSAEATTRRVDLVIQNVTVIDPETQRVLPARSVYVDAGKIISVRPAARSSGLIARRTISGKGRFLIPGLMDMHAHLFLPEAPKSSLNLLLANGVTSIREMSSDCWAAAGVTEGCIASYRKLQSDIRAGRVVGPDLVALTSPMIMGPTRLKLPEGTPSFVTPVTPGEGTLATQELTKRGVDLIKTHDSIPFPAFQAIMQEAKRTSQRVGGHIPFRAGSVGAAELGYASIEHARDLLYDCSRFGAEFRRREADFAEGVAGSARPPNLERLTRTVTEFDSNLCLKMLSRLARTGVYYVPTHVTREMEALAADPAYRADPSRKFIMPDRNARWEDDLADTAKLPANERSALAAFYRHGLRITGLAHQAGVPIMAGTDLNDTMITPGFSLHRELRLLHEAGLSNMAVLRAATTVPAAYLARSKDLGGISAGKQADLVLLRLNPLKDISNTRAIEAVINDGRVLSRAELDDLLNEVRQLVISRR
jgi:hypothetical protein